MDKLLHDLGGIVLNALPTSFIVIVLAIFVKKIYLQPLEKVLAERHRLTEGARAAAEQGLHAADSKIAEYEAALNKARSEIYAQQADFVKGLQAEQAVRMHSAKSSADSAIAAMRDSLAKETAAARQQLATQSEQLASEIADSVLASRRQVV